MRAAMTDGVLFDLDGTLADTAPDLAEAVNQLRIEHGMEPMSLVQLRPFTSSGARGMLRAAFGINPEHPSYSDMVARFLAKYASRICVDTRIFDGMEALLDTLESNSIPWGIVTNKQSRFTEPLVTALQLHKRACCIVSGDSAARPKPAADPLLLACQQAKLDPTRCIYVGDDLRDIVAGRAAGMKTVAAAYGYLGEDLPIESWQADAIIHAPTELREIVGL